MTKIDKNRVLKEVIEFCRFPVPKTPIDIVRHLKALNKNFYPKTPDKQVVKFLKKNYLNDLVEKGLLVKYEIGSGSWEKARKLLSYYESNNKTKPTRKVTELYQVNFLNFFNEKNDFLFKLPCFKEINLDLIVFLYNSMKAVDKKELEIKNFSFVLINLMMAYRDEQTRDKIRIKLYNLNFTDKEIDSIEKLLEYSLFMNDFFEKIPFKPNAEKAVELLEKISESKIN